MAVSACGGLRTWWPHRRKTAASRANHSASPGGADSNTAIQRETLRNARALAEVIGLREPSSRSLRTWGS